MTGLRILVLSSTLPWPGHGGGLLVNNLLRELNQRHEVTLLAYVKASEEHHIADVAALCAHIMTVPMPTLLDEAVANDEIGLPEGAEEEVGALRRVWRALPKPIRTAAYDLRNLPGRWRKVRQAAWPAEVMARHTPEFATALQQLVEDQAFDVAVAEWPEMVPYHHLLVASTLTVYDSHELRSITYRRRLKSQRSIEGALYWFYQWRKMMTVEALATNTFDVVTAVSRMEAEVLEKYGGTAEIVIHPFGLNMSSWPDKDIEPRWENVLIYLGRMSYTPNQDAVRYFLAQIYPQIRAEVADVSFIVIGGSPPADILEYNGVDGISVTGFVPDVREHLLRGTVFVLPIRQGAGIKVKAMEAMAAGIPIVSTKEGAEGLDDIVDGEDILIARGAKDFAAKAVQLLRDEGLRQRIADKARQAAWERYDSAITSRKLEEVIERKIARRQKEGRNNGKIAI